MWTDANVSNIKSTYNLKTLFSYIDYKKILKLIKYNKNLQKRLGLNIDNYKNKSDFPKYEYTKETQIVSRYYKHRKGSEKEITKFLVSVVTCLFLFPFLIYSIILVSIKNFKNSNTRDNYNKKYYNIIKAINPCLFIYDAFILGCCFLKVYYIYHDISHDYGKRKIIKFILMIFINVVYLLFEFLVILKLILSYKIKKGGCTWFMVLDYIFIVINFIYISCFLHFTYSFFKESGNLISMSSKYFLVAFNKIKIDNYELPNDFDKLPKKGRKSFVLNNYRSFKCTISQQQKELIRAINDYRGINDIPLLGICQCKQIPDFLIKESSEIMMFPEQNMFKLSNNKYLFKYPIGIFEIGFKNKDKIILSILLKDNLNHIQIITHQNFEYILIYELVKCSFHNTEFKYDSSSGGLRHYKLSSINDKFNSYTSNYINKHYYE